jgi:uncharacterized protein
MPGSINLQEVLDSMQISCNNIEYGFATLPIDADIAPRDILAMFYEDEGLTVIAPTGYLDFQSISFEGPYARLTIESHTSLELVGLTAALAKKLTDVGIPTNIVAAYYHDHIFVPYDARDKAAEALISLRV